MDLFENTSGLQQYLKNHKMAGKSVGLVPTMGALHEGHISLLKASKDENQVSIATIFVNPLQFNNQSDLKLYPRTLEKDLERLKNAGCDAVFFPKSEEIYKEEPRIKLSFGKLEGVMEGKYRPGHFNGVGIIVAKLFNIISPDKAYFGQKDLQQFLIIQQMVKDLSFPIDLRCCPILREADGLAMSSRNVRISKENRPLASKIYESLLLAKKILPSEGVENTKNTVRSFLEKHKELKIEYFEIADGETLESINNVKEHKQVALCIAVYLDEVRLIDNIFLFS